MYRIALIPAAGRGARLDRPNTPKPLVDVAGTSIILRTLRQLQSAGVEKAIIVVGYDAERIMRHIYKHPEITIELEFVQNDTWEDGLASSILSARHLIDEPFVLTMADHLYDPVLIPMLVDTDISGDASAMLIDTQMTGIHDIDDAVKVRLQDDRIKRIGRQLTEYDGVDIGLFAFTPTIFNALEKVIQHDGEVDLTEALAVLLQQNAPHAIDIGDAYWHDIDTPAALIRAEMQLRKERRLRAMKNGAHHRQINDLPSERYVYQFTTGKPVKTDVLVQRGIVRQPQKLAIIGDESASSPIYVFTDTRVNELYGDDFVGGLREQGYDVHRIVMAEGEESKTLDNYTRLVEQILGQGIDEKSVLISLGGGAVCNVCGFIASTLYRGIELVHVPTTLMAQCDAAISHKQGINGRRGKNLVGSYYAPSRIVVDVDVLATLEDWLIPDGLSEVIKHALGQDIDYLDYLLKYDGDMRNPDFLEYVVRKNIELKCDLMAVDPKEHYEGMVLQYGHTVGHPVEYLSGYDLNHGQSVGIGMMVAVHVARILGACDDETVAVHRKVIEKYELPSYIPRTIKIDDILATMRYNKRYLMEGTRMALLSEPGKLWSVDGEYAIPVSDAVLREAIAMSYEPRS